MEPVVLIQKLENLYLVFGYPLVFLGSLLEVTPIAWVFPTGVFVILGGFYSYGSKILPLIGILIAGWTGEWLAFLATYFLGYKKTGLIKKLNQEENAIKAQHLFAKHGPLIMSTSMMAGFTRFWIAYIAGQQKYSFRKFLYYSGGASLTWTALMVAVGYIAGAERHNLEVTLSRFGYLGWILLLLAIGVIIITVKKEFGGKSENSRN
ncbi:hypothetical protein A2630_00420 [Candidatus Woesebacteria bacterium RIFCSPHIGHO2_01_FULL_44_10]|uniref:VTT domain-containing protein n=1 Tax=Candidatus Woesebacteria bacterium RIFCSPLOWO2_01_FULL_44_14 TaxID=1802525 RepID=A0A1F8C142_9BACT|nr:MAG: hypothetical protein A2630_00420 [Candidatus Woesebacteria bacterium RIFCSPHIGHO2_01_FULL_44_10]OGM53727.1 MAG: hypothetical protein A3F62_03625 [Candidatus Woesebacteria bacterium RIFCSPHIGHO2_12_FULL_44_11]OGM70074.1 MAG: hypothetical protein A2975_03290 [Candidatus Woesebacteria bacterium RIFCSPLOWO2_01_FULL_44_14]